MLAGLAFLVTLFYLWRRNKPIWFIVGPTLHHAGAADLGTRLPDVSSRFRLAAARQLPALGDRAARAWLQIWIVVEGVLIWRAAHGMLEEKLPPLSKPALSQATADGGRSC